MKCEVGICEITKKKIFSSYNDCVKYSRYVSRKNKIRRKSIGSEYKRKANGDLPYTNHVNVKTKAISAAGIIFQAITKVLKHANLKKNGLKHIPPKTRKSDKNDYKYTEKL